MTTREENFKKNIEEIEKFFEKNGFDTSSTEILQKMTTHLEKVLPARKNEDDELFTAQIAVEEIAWWTILSSITLISGIVVCCL